MGDRGKLWLHQTKITGLRALGLISLAGAIAVFVVGPPHPPSQPHAQPPAPAQETSPGESPPHPDTASHPSPLRLPDGFPETAGPYLLESIREETKSDGMITYFSARYTAGEGEAINVRLVGLSPDHARAFAATATQNLRKSASIETVRLPEDLHVQPGESATLLVRNNAGLFLFGAKDHFLVVAAPDPDAALTVGRSLTGR